MSEDRLTTRDIARNMEAAAGEQQRPHEAGHRDDPAVPMFAADEAAGYRTQWDGIQTGFVDEPRRAVEEADGLVAHVITRLSEVFAEERTTLERQWDRGEQISTEDLRVALRKYRSFFERLLSL